MNHFEINAIISLVLGVLPTLRKGGDRMEKMYCVAGKKYTTAQAARIIGISKDTLLRWLATGKIKKPARDGRNWRVWFQENIDEAREYKEAYNPKRR